MNVAQITPDINVYNQVLAQEAQKLAGDAAIERAGMTSHIIVCEKAIDERDNQIASLQELLAQVESEKAMLQDQLDKALAKATKTTAAKTK